MKEGMDPTQQGRTYRWRPAVAPYRPRSASRRRPHKPVPGQMSLPGLELDAGSEQEPRGPAQAADTAASDASQPALVCPNCGGTEFDDDGDCTRCWEPGVFRS